MFKDVRGNQSDLLAFINASNRVELEELIKVLASGEYRILVEDWKSKETGEVETKIVIRKS